MSDWNNYKGFIGSVTYEYDVDQNEKEGGYINVHKIHNVYEALVYAKQMYVGASILGFPFKTENGIKCEGVSMTNYQIDEHHFEIPENQEGLHETHNGISTGGFVIYIDLVNMKYAIQMSAGIIEINIKNYISNPFIFWHGSVFVPMSKMMELPSSPEVLEGVSIVKFEYGSKKFPVTINGN